MLSKDVSLQRAPPLVLAWDAPELNEGACLFSEGFRLVSGYPVSAEPPYVVLAHPFESPRNCGHYEMGVYLGRTSRHNLGHPEASTPDDLVEILASHLACSRSEEIKTLTGPVPIYVGDPSWYPIAMQFIERYGKISELLPNK